MKSEKTAHPKKRTTTRNNVARKLRPAKHGNGTRAARTVKRRMRVPTTAPRTSGAGATKVGARIRMYRVGFGDFFLLSFPAPSGPPLYALIDCGVHAVDLGSIDDAIADMAKITNGQLALVVMTHRHADHISGFARGAKTFANFTVERVWMSWFEDPNNTAAAKYQSTLTAVAANLQATFALRAVAPDSDYVNMVANATGGLSVAGGPTGNQAALKVLRSGFKNRPPIDYYQAGDTPVLPQSLVQAGVTAQILGPPRDVDLIAQMDGKGHEYLATNSESTEPPKGFNPIFEEDARAYPRDAFDLYTPDEIAQKVAAVQPDLAIAKAKQVDNTLNNQSLVILFSVQGKKLLFAGDAQWGNWQNFLFGGALGTAGHNALTPDAQMILQSVDVYKVGHHGSRNATPIDALNAMREDCIAMCSTQPGAYGKTVNNSEVPRIPLMAALNKKTDNQLARSDSVTVPGAEDPKIQKVEDENPPGPLPKIFQAGTGGDAGQLYVEVEI